MSTTPRASTRATSASAPIRSSRRACATPTCCSSSAPAWARSTTGGYTLVAPGGSRQTLVHVHSGAEELGRVYQPALAIVSGSPQFAAAARALEPVDSSAWRAETEQAHADHLASMQHTTGPGELQMGEVMAWLRERLPEDSILTNGAGNFSVWAHRFYEFRRFPSQLAPTSGAMGYGLPAAVAAKLLHPDRIVVCFAGDGDFLMSGQELATAVQYELPIVVLVVNNGMYGTIRMHQERHYPGRVSGTDLVNPDFARYAEAFGGHGEVVERTERVRAGVRACGRVRPAGGDRAARRPGGDHAAADADPDSRASAQSVGSTKCEQRGSITSASRPGTSRSRLASTRRSSASSACRHRRSTSPSSGSSSATGSSTSSSRAPTAPQFHHIGLEVDDFEAFYVRLTELGIVDSDTLGPMRELPSGEVQLYLRDPGGNLVEIDWPDASTLDRAIITDLRKLADDQPQAAGAERASLFAGRTA